MAARKSAKTGECVCGVQLERVDKGVLAASCERFGIQRSSVRVRVLRLFERTRRTVPIAEQVRCAECGGMNGARDVACRFCGSSVLHAPSWYGTSPLGLAVPPAARPAFGGPPVPAEPPPPASVAALGGAGRPGQAPPGPPVPGAGERPAGRLGRAVAVLRRLSGAVAGASWDLGDGLLAVCVPGLYRERYGSWEEFLFVELGMTVPTAARLMAVARAFNRATVEELGVARLTVALRVPEERRAALLDQARAGLGLGALADEARKLGLTVSKAGHRDLGGEIKRPMLRVPTGDQIVHLRVGNGGIPLDGAPRRTITGAGSMRLPGSGELRFKVLVRANGGLVLHVAARGKGETS